MLVALAVLLVLTVATVAIARRGNSRHVRAAVPGGKRRDFFGDRIPAPETRR